uniref:unspecific monooxygenase n=1 Tax=Phyllonorycter ringoniella TaxID=571297 RepID=A0A0K0QVU8_9NEOP|nr:CYP6AN20 protein [Phyllonorycter ringoniella]
MLAIFICTVAAFTIYFYFTRKHSYWAKKGIKHEATIPLFGTHYQNFFGIKSITQIVQNLYNQHENEKFIGYYRGNTPELIVKDPDMIRQILSVDFSSFYARGMGRDPVKEPLLLSLFHVEGDTWKLLRQRLTPAFTTNKLKNMFPLIIKCAEKMEKVVDDLTMKDEYDVRELMARFTTEFIGACGFGIEMDSINNERSQFRELGRLMFNPPWKQKMLTVLYDLIPELFQYISASNPVVEDSMSEIFLNLRKQRNYKPIGRNDFVDLLLELESKGTIEGESLEKGNKDGTPEKIRMELDVKCMTAQLFVFFAAGFETSSSATSYLIHELALNPEIQRKVPEDIANVLARYDNKLCYEAVAEMRYLDMALKESLRLFPSLGVLNRVCTRKYTFPGTDLTIDPGVKVMIPVHSIQNDEKYYDNPTEFRPERFLPEEVQKRHKFVYLPFGEGPRACIGERLGHMQSLAGLAAMLHKYSFEPSKSTKLHLEPDPWSNVVQAVIGGVPLKINKRNK